MGGQNWMFGIVPFIFVFAVYYIYPQFGDISHRGYNASLFYQYADRAMFLIFATTLCFAFLILHFKIRYPKVIANMGANSLLYYFWHAYLRFICIYVYHCAAIFPAGEACHWFPANIHQALIAPPFLLYNTVYYTVYYLTQ